MPSPPFALFITWTCYGTWLPGDERGYVSNTLQPDKTFVRKQNQYRSPISHGDSRTLAAAKTSQHYNTVQLHADDALTAADALMHAAEERGWFIVRAALMANHVHTLTTHCADDGPAVRRIFKGVSSAELSKAGGRPFRWWTHGGSDRYLHDQPAIDAVERYIRDQPGILCQIVNMRVIPRI